jgi:hypothetical protein
MASKIPTKFKLGATLRLPELTTDAMDDGPPIDADEPAESPAPPSLPINRTSFVLPPWKHYPEATKKDLIVLHFTAGRDARGAFNTWLNNLEQAGAVIPRDALHC